MQQLEPATVGPPLSLESPAAAARRSGDAAPNSQPLSSFSQHNSHLTSFAPPLSLETARAPPPPSLLCPLSIRGLNDSGKAAAPWPLSVESQPDPSLSLSPWPGNNSTAAVPCLRPPPDSVPTATTLVHSTPQTRLNTPKIRATPNKTKLQRDIFLRLFHLFSYTNYMYRLYLAFSVV